MIQKIVLRKSFYKKTPNIGVLFSAIADMWFIAFPKGTDAFHSSQMPFYEYCEVLQNIIFTEQCCTTASDFLWHFQCITCFISDKSVSHSIKYNISIISVFPASNYMFKVNNRNTRTRCEICSKLTINTPEQRHWHRWYYIIILVLY